MLLLRLVAIVLAFALLPLPAREAAKTATFNIPAGNPFATFRQFTEQSGVQLLYAADELTGVDTNPVQGNLTPSAAIDQMLAGTSLVAARAANGAIGVKRTSALKGGKRVRRTAAVAGPAGVVPASTVADASTEEPLVLSPFEVTAEEDRGYQALNTLGGTRLRTDLRDLAVSMSVVTKQLMEDLAADDLDVLAPYLLGTEIGGINGNFSNTLDNFSAGGFTDFAGQIDNLTPKIRVRGLAPASRTRDFFLTDIPGDGYNIERIEIQRGPNGMLYGLGSPSGVVNNSLMRASVQRNRTKITTRLDRYASYRAALDHNQTLVKDKLAFRLATLYNHTEFQIKDAFGTDRRASGTITYKPFNGTTIRVFGETALVRSTPPQTRPPLDGFSYWWAVGKPVYDASTRTFSFLGGIPTGTGINGNPAQFLSSGRLRAGNPSLIIEDPNTGVYGLSIPGHPQAAVLAPARAVRNAANTGWLNSFMYSTNLATSYLQAINGGASNPANAFWRIPQMADPAVFDFFNHQLDGPARTRDGRWKNYNVALEQRLGRHAGIEIGFDHQYLDEIFRNMVQFNNYAINLDVTTTLVDGTPNPNFGRPFMAAPAIAGASTNRLRDAFRATGYNDFDFKRIFREGSLVARILGRHTLTSNYTWQDYEERYLRGNAMLDLAYYNMVQAGNAGTSAVANVNSTGPRQINIVTYLGPNVAATASPQHQGIQGLETASNFAQSGLSSLTLYYKPVPPASATVPNEWRIQQFNAIGADDWSNAAIANFARHNYSKFKALSAVLQDRWFDNILVSTFGWRRDWVNTFAVGQSQFDATGRLIQNDAVWPLLPQVNQRRDAFNYGLVLHLPKFIQRRLPKSAEISFLYNRSDNFTPDSARHDIYGRQIDPPSGETKEYGILLSLFDRRLDLRATRYESGSTLATNSSFVTTIQQIQNVTFNALNSLDQGFYDFAPDEPGYVPANVKQAYLDFFRSPAASPFYSPEVAGFHVDASGALQGTNGGPSGLYETSDTSAKGLEIEVTANVTANWRIMANAARQESVKSNSANALWAMLQSWRPLVVDGLAGDMPISPGGGNTWRDAFITNEATVRRIRALDGLTTPEVRKWRFNVVTNYSRHAGFLEGWGVGGAVRGRTSRPSATRSR